MYKQALEEALKRRFGENLTIEVLASPECIAFTRGWWAAHKGQGKHKAYTDRTARDHFYRTEAAWCLMAWIEGYEAFHWWNRTPVDKAA